MVLEHPPLWHGLVAGASSAVVSRLFTYPPDTIKSRLQVQGVGGAAKSYTGTTDAFVKIARMEGIQGFYRGFGAIVLTVIPANMCYFSAYEIGKRVTPRDWGTGSDLMTATFAQTVAGLVFCPIDIVKQRVQTASVMGGPAAAHQPVLRLTPVQAAQEVWRHQGAAGFYRGFMAMNTLWLPWNLIYLSLYEASKRSIYGWQLDKLRGSEQQSVSVSAHGGVAVVQAPPMSQVLPVWAFPLCSSSCAAIAAVATHPVDVVKTRLQVMSAAAKGKYRRTAWQVARELFATDGVAGFGRGAVARVSTLSIGSSISWCVYEMVKRELELSSLQRRRKEEEEGFIL